MIFYTRGYKHFANEEEARADCLYWLNFIIKVKSGLEDECFSEPDFQVIQPITEKIQVDKQNCKKIKHIFYFKSDSKYGKRTYSHSYTVDRTQEGE